MLTQTSPSLKTELKKSAVPGSDFNLDLYASGCEGRQEVEHFIQQGFYRAYQASISVTMPYVLALKEGKFKAALGIRYATAPLFVEQYLDRPIETLISQQGFPACRAEIAEIGHLYSNAKKFTIPLFLVAAVSLFYRDMKYMVFAGTPLVIDIIQRSRVKVTALAPANPSLLQPSKDDWGTYYKTQPQVVIVSLDDVMKVVSNIPHYQALFTELMPKIARVTQKMQVLV